VSIPEAEQRKLFARSGNLRAIPDCRRLLTADVSPPDPLVVPGKVPHIVAERPGGPPGSFPLPLEDRNRAENLIQPCTDLHQSVESAAFPD